MTAPGAKARKRALQQLQNDAAAVLEHPQSMRFLCRVMAECGMFVQLPAYDNAIAQSRALGRQDAAHSIVRMLQEADEQALVRLMEFAHKQRASVDDNGDDHAAD